MSLKGVVEGLKAEKSVLIFAKSVCKENSFYNCYLFVCLKELAQGILGRLCLLKAILTKTSP
jgi:hypothetical protein